MRARGIALPILDSGARGGGGGQRHAPAALYTPKRRPVPIVQEPGWASGPVWMGLGASLDGSGKSHHTGVRTPDSTARSECVETGLRIFALKL